MSSTHYLAAAVAALLALAPAQAAPPAAAYAALPVGIDARLSPDGTAIAMIGNAAGKQAFVVVHLNGMPPKVFSAGDWTPQSVVWKSSARFIGSLRTTLQFSNSGQSYRTASIVTIAADGSSVRRMNLPYASVISMLPSEPDNVLVYSAGIGHEVTERINVVDGGHADIHSVHNDFYALYADANGNVRAAVQHKAATMGRRNEERNLFARAGEDDSWHQITHEVFDGKLGYSVVGFAPSDPDQVYLLTDGPGAYHVIRVWNISTGQPGAIIAASPGRDIEPVMRDSQFIGYTDNVDDGVPHYFDPAWQHDADLVHHALGQGRIALVDRTADGKRALASVQQGAMPLEYWLLDRTSGKTRLNAVVQSYEGITQADVAPVRRITYAARDGLQIPALLTLPPNHAAGPLPFVIMPHGGPSAHDRLGFDWMAQFIASRGYGVLQPQFRGSTGFGSALHDAGLRRWGLEMQDDLTDGTKYLAAQHLADPNRICIFGASYGGYAALEGVVKEPTLYRCAAALAPVTDLLRITGGGVNANTGDLNLPLPDADTKTLESASPINGVDRIRVPILLVHGKQDFTAQTDHSRQMEYALKRAGKTVTAVYLDDTDHYLSSTASRLAFLQALETFLAANLSK